MLQYWFYVKHTGTEARPLAHPKLLDQLVAVFPVGARKTVGTKLWLEPGEIAKIPSNVYSEAARREPWLEEVSEAEYDALFSEMRDVLDDWLKSKNIHWRPQKPLPVFTVDSGDEDTAAASPVEVEEQVPAQAKTEDTSQEVVVSQPVEVEEQAPAAAYLAAVKPKPRTRRARR